MKTCPNCGMPASTKQRVCESCGAGLAPVSEPTNESKEPVEIPAHCYYSLKWYKFLIYFWLFFSALDSIAAAVLYFTGAMYTRFGDAFSLYIQSMKIPNTVYGVFLLFMAAYTLVTRFRLAKFKKDGPYMLYGLFIIKGAASLI